MGANYCKECNGKGDLSDWYRTKCKECGGTGLMKPPNNRPLPPPPPPVVKQCCGCCSKPLHDDPLMADILERLKYAYAKGVVWNGYQNQTESYNGIAEVKRELFNLNCELNKKGY